MRLTESPLRRSATSGRHFRTVERILTRCFRNEWTDPQVRCLIHRDPSVLAGLYDEGPRPPASATERAAAVGRES